MSSHQLNSKNKKKIKSLRPFTVVCCKDRKDRHGLKLEKVVQLFQGSMLSGHYPDCAGLTFSALFRIGSTILHFQHSFFPWLLRRTEGYFAFWATFKHFFFTIFHMFNLIFCLRNVFSKPRRVIPLS